MSESRVVSELVRDGGGGLACGERVMEASIEVCGWIAWLHKAYGVCVCKIKLYWPALTIDGCKVEVRSRLKACGRQYLVEFRLRVEDFERLWCCASDAKESEHVIHLS